MSSSTRPLPSLEEVDTGDFWRATKDKVLQYQRCKSCGTVVWYPRAFPAQCADGETEILNSDGKGTIYSFSVVRQSYHPFFRNLVPYAVAYVDLDEGFRMLTNVTGVEDPVNELAIGQRVELVWEEHEELSIPLFKPAV